MQKVIFVNSVKGLKSSFLREGRAIKYIVFEESLKNNRIREYISHNLKLEEIDKNELFREEGEKFRENYVNLMGNLNRKNSSLFWWASNFTDKNPNITPLAREIFHFVLLFKLINKGELYNILVVGDNINLLKQLKIYKNGKIRIINLLRLNYEFKKLLEKFTPLLIFYAFLRSLIHKICACLFVRYKPSPAKHYNIIRTILNHQSFSQKSYYFDTYFGELPRYLASNNIPYIIFGEIIPDEGYLATLRKIHTNYPDLPIIPLEKFYLLSDMIKCLYYALSKYILPISFNIEAIIDGIDVRYLIKRALRDSYSSSQFFVNLSSYYCTRSLVKNITVNRFLYPFENRSWEKMSVLAIKNIAKEIKVIGYQHTSMALKHMNFFLRDGEDSVMPLPDRIVTIGRRAKNFLETHGSFPKDILRTGGYLRQKKTETRSIKSKNSKVTNILLALATDLEEYINTIVFLNKAFQELQGYEILIRPHPHSRVSIQECIKSIPDFNINYNIDTKPLSESLKWADLVFYASATVSIEAISMGIPVVHIAYDSCFNIDSLKDLYEFKWTADSPEKVKDIIDEIDNMPLEYYTRLQEKARNFSSEYINTSSTERFGILLK